MSLEQKIQTGERSLLKRFLHSAKSKVLTSALGLAMLTPLACDGRHRTPAPGPVNNAPVITTTAPTSGLEGSLYNYDVDATDAEGDPISYSLDTAPLWASINATSGLITGTPTDSGANRTDNFTVRATDSKGASSVQNFGVNVTNLGSVSGTGQVKDIDANGLASKTVHLWNTTYPRGRFTGLTNGSGDFTIVDTNIPALSGIPNGSYNLEVEDGYTGIFKFLQPGYATSGNSHTVTNLSPMILMHSIASTNTAYQDSLGNASFLALFKYETVTRPSDSGTHQVVAWPTSSVPVPVYLNAVSAPSTDNEDASGNPTPNGVSDVIDRARRALAEWNTQSGMTLFTEVSSTPGQGIRFLWPSTGNSATNFDWYNADNTVGRVTITVTTGQPLNNIFIDQKHELGHATRNYGQHSAEPNLYIMYIGATQPSNIHVDEGRVAKYYTKLPHLTNMDLYVDQ